MPANHPDNSSNETQVIANKNRVYVFTTCLVNMFRPAVGLASVSLLQAAGFHVKTPRLQVCCGQPAYNNGHPVQARAIAKNVINLLSPADFVVVPSGSCASMLVHHYPQLFEPGTPGNDAINNGKTTKRTASGEENDWHQRALALADKTYELTQFLVDVADITQLPAQAGKKLTVHDSCAALRELGIKEQPRKLLATAGFDTLYEHGQAESCCGFGGTFCIKYPEISNQMVSRKAKDIQQCGADTVVSTDLGCLMNLSGKLSRLGAPVDALHIAELLCSDRGRTGDAK